jgi:hypothetical protein
MPGPTALTMAPHIFKTHMVPPPQLPSALHPTTVAAAAACTASLPSEAAAAAASGCHVGLPGSAVAVPWGLTSLQQQQHSLRTRPDSQAAARRPAAQQQQQQQPGLKRQRSLSTAGAIDVATADGYAGNSSSCGLPAGQQQRQPHEADGGGCLSLLAEVAAQVGRQHDRSACCCKQQGCCCLHHRAERSAACCTVGTLLVHIAG